LNIHASAREKEPVEEAENINHLGRTDLSRVFLSEASEKASDRFVVPQSTELQLLFDLIIRKAFPVSLRA
jgi:hypothetical protein